MAHVLNAKALARLKDIMAEPCTTNQITRDRILDWALDPELGSLPSRSARMFSDWLDEVWDDWTEDPEQTVKDILEGAVTDWCGGRVMPS